MAITYRVKGMRVILPNNRKNTEVALTVKGDFYSETGEKMSLKSKDITHSQAASDDFAIDIAKGTVTLPAGKRGRTSVASVSQNDLNNYLASLKGKAKS